jgi:hypothetical protein
VFGRLRRSFQRPPEPPPTRAEIEDTLQRLTIVARECATGTFELLPEIPAARMTWYDAETTCAMLSYWASVLERRLPNGSEDRHRLAEAREALNDAIATLPAQPRDRS